MAFFSNQRAQTPAPQSGQLNKAMSIKMPSGPSDSTSTINWSPDGTLLSAAGWDRQVRIWQINTSTSFGGAMNITPTAKILYNHSAPILTSCFGGTNNIFFAGGCDKMMTMYDLNSGNTNGQLVAQHDQPISASAWNSQQNVFVTGSWDGMVRMWDGKQAQPVWQHNLNAKVFSMDRKNHLLTVGDSKRCIHIWDLRSIGQNSEPLSFVASFKMQLRCVSLFPDTNQFPGVAAGSVEGKCAIMYAKEELLRNNFCYKCHRVDQQPPQAGGQQVNIYAVNSIDFHLKYGSFATAGSDGTIVFWDKDIKHRIRAFDNLGAPVTCVKINPSGNNLMAYSIAYDWHKGADQGELSKNLNEVCVHQLKEDDVHKKHPAANQQRR